MEIIRRALLDFFFSFGFLVSLMLSDIVEFLVVWSGVDFEFLVGLDEVDFGSLFDGISSILYGVIGFRKSSMASSRKAIVSEEVKESAEEASISSVTDSVFSAGVSRGEDGSVILILMVSF